MKTKEWPNLSNKEPSPLNSKLIDDYLNTRKESKKMLNKIYGFAIVLIYISLFVLLYFQLKEVIN